MRFLLHTSVTMALVILPILTLSATARGEVQTATLARPSTGVIVATADYSFYNYTDYSHVKLQTGAHRLKKILDLSEIDPADFAAVRTAQVSIFMYAEDGQGDGFNGAFDVVVNGH